MRFFRAYMLAMREIDLVFDPERKLVLYFGITFLAIAVGPFGTYEAMTLSERAIFWSLDVLGGLVILVPVLHVFFRSRLGALLPSWPRFLLGVALGALPTAGYITVLYEAVAADIRISTPFPLLFVQVCVFSSMLLIVEFKLWPAIFGEGHRRPPRAPNAGALAAVAPMPATAPAKPRAPVEPPVRGPALLDRLPPEHARAEIVSISMQDHYAEIATTAGKALILMRLSDAIELVQDCPGARIHRSHWVARAHVDRIERNGRRYEVVMKDGRRLPIGNTYLAAARGALGLAAIGREAGGR